MATVIGDWAIKLGLSAQSFSGGVKAAEGQAKTFASKAQALASSTSSTITGILKSVTGLDLGGATSMLSGLASSAGSLLSSFNPASLVTSVAAITTAILGAGFAAVKSTNDIVKLARAHGISGQDATGLALTAARVGIDPAAFGDMLGRFTLRMGEVRQQLQAGGGPMISALQRLGINAREFAQLPVHQQLAAIADGMQSMTNPVDRAALGFDLLGRHARDMAPVFRLSGEEIRNAGQHAADYGDTLSELGVQQIGQAMRDVREARVAFVTIGGSLTSTIAEAFATTVSAGAKLGKSIITFLQPAFRMVGAIITFVGAIFGRVFSGIQSVLSPVLGLLGGIFTVIGEVFSGVFEILSAVFDVVASVVGAILEGFGMSGAGTAVQQLTQFFKDLARSVAEVSGRIASMIRAAGSIASVAGGSSPGAGAGLNFGTWLAQRLSGQQAINDGLMTEAQIRANIDSKAAAAAAEPRLDVRVSGLSSIQQVTTELERYREQLALVRLPLSEGETAAAQISQSTNAIRDRIAFAGLDADAQERYRLRRLGATQADLDGIQALQQLAAAATAASDAQTLSQGYRASLDTMGMTSRQAEIWRLQQRGVNTELLETLRMQDRVLSQAEARRDLEAQVARLNGEVSQGSVATFEARLTELRGMLDAGLSPDAYGAQVAAAFSGLERTVGQAANNAPRALLAGSAEAASTVAAYQREGAGNDPQERVRQVMERALEVQRLQLAETRRLVSAVEESQNLPGVDF